MSEKLTAQGPEVIPQHSFLSPKIDDFKAFQPI